MSTKTQTQAKPGECRIVSVERQLTAAAMRCWREPQITLLSAITSP